MSDGCCERCGGCESCFYAKDLLVRAIKELVRRQRTIDGEFSGDSDASEYELWQDPIINELLTAAGFRANKFRDLMTREVAESNSGYIDLEACQPYSYFMNLEVPYVPEAW